jgi:release factor glutamine methyltransferase
MVGLPDGTARRLKEAWSLMENAATEDERWTILRLLQWTTDYFRKHGSESARLEAEVLLAHVRGQSRIQLYTSFDQEPTPEQLARFRKLVRQRATGEPVAYLVGTREFFSLPLIVDRRVLIPRPETEHLVVAALDAAREWLAAAPGEPVRIADVGTGSGAVAIAIATHLPQATIWAGDRSLAALEVAGENVRRAALDDRITLCHSDLLDDAPPSLEIIVSNPPYVRSDEFDALPPDVRDFEPREALVAGPLGTEVIERLIQQAMARLRPGGSLLFEHSPQLADACRALLVDWDGVRSVRDLAGHVRIHQARRPVR